MPAFNRYIGELFAFSLLTKQEVLDICKQNYNDGAIRTMRGVPPMHQQYDLQQLKELYDESLTAARKQFQESLPSVTTAARTTELPPPVAPVRVVPSAHPKAVPQHVSQPAVPLLTDNPVLTLATLLSAAVPLARHLSSDTCTSEQRSQLRDLMGERGMFDLSNEINALCSERARSMRK